MADDEVEVAGVRDGVHEGIEAHCGAGLEEPRLLEVVPIGDVPRPCLVDDDVRCLRISDDPLEPLRQLLLRLVLLLLLRVLRVLRGLRVLRVLRGLRIVLLLDDVSRKALLDMPMRMPFDRDLELYEELPQGLVDPSLDSPDTAGLNVLAERRVLRDGDGH